MCLEILPAHRTAALLLSHRGCGGGGHRRPDRPGRPVRKSSKAPGIEWIGDSFPELLQERLNSPALYVLPREDRLRAYDRFGIPVPIRPSRATIYRIAEQMGVDYVVLGEYNFDGQTFSAKAQLLDMHREHLLPEITESGPLVQLIDIQTSLSWDILHTSIPVSPPLVPPFWPKLPRCAWMLSKVTSRA